MRCAEACRSDQPHPNPSSEEEGHRPPCFAEAAARLAGISGALLGWRPDEFWRATPAELAAVLAALSPPGEAGLSGGELARLMERFPDG